MTIQTKMQPADQLVVGVRFIPRGKKRPVTVIAISEFHAATLDVYAESAQGVSAHIINRYEDVEVVSR